MNNLAIVIPYYKPEFFRQALQSIKNQDDQRFQLYIGDDCSPHDPRQIIEEVFGSLFSERLTYHKFSINLGSISLTKQWERCISLSKNETYLWLFADDDQMPTDAVSRFYKFFPSVPDNALLRFNVRMINDGGSEIQQVIEHPYHETAFEFLNRRLQGRAISSISEYIFPRKNYNEMDGFVDFPLAWASDDATWLNFGKISGIFTIPGKPVCWRFGSMAISFSNENYKSKIDASIKFLEFIKSKYVIEERLILQWLFMQHALFKMRSPTITVYFVIQVLGSGLVSPLVFFSFAGRKAADKVVKVFNWQS